MNSNLLYTGKITAIISFVIGTCLFAFYLYFDEQFIDVFLAFFFVVGALIFNTILVIIIFGQALLNRVDRFEALRTVGLMLLNIPISILYFYLLINFPDHHTLL